MTLADLANASGVSRASLSRIENGEVSPTADTLARLSSALNVSISQLIAPMEDRLRAYVPREEQPVFEDTKHGFQRRSISPPDPHLSVELVEASLKPGAMLSYDMPSRPGHEHHIALLSGGLTVIVAGETYALSHGDCLRYLLNGASQFRAGPQGAHYILALA